VLVQRRASSSCHLSLLKLSATIAYTSSCYVLTSTDRLQDKSSTFAGPIDVVKQVIKKEGVLGLYAGMEATFWRSANPYSSVPSY
jgi:hypothetical protein